MRRFARGELKVQDFVIRFMHEPGRNSADAAAQRIVAKFAEPAFRELREWLRTRMADVPASDRTVRFDHNSAPYNDALAKLDDVAEALRGSNQLDPELKEQLATELSAGRQLFEAPRVRVAVIRVVLVGALAALALVVPDFGVGLLANVAMLAVQAVISAGREL